MIDKTVTRRFLKEYYDLSFRCLEIAVVHIGVVLEKKI